MISGLAEPPARRGSVDWPSLLLRFGIVAIPLWVTVAALIFNIDWRLKLVVGSVLLTTLLAPDKGLLLTAILAPLGRLVGELIEAGDFRITEAIVIAFLVGWALRASRDRPGPTVPAWLVAALFGVTIAASIAGSAWRLGVPGESGRVVRDVFFLYFYMVERFGLIEGARLLEGLALFAATMQLFRKHPALAVTLPAALAVSGVAAAAASFSLWFGIGFAADLRRYQEIGYRVSAHVMDVNAAGSYFAMLACLGLGMAVRARGRARALWCAAAAANLGGLWLSVSRSAVLATAIALAGCAIWTLSTRWKSSTRAIALAGMVTVAVSLGALWAWQATREGGYRGVGFRAQFNATSLRMIQASPVFGIGVGQYYPLSPMFLTPELAWTYGHENAHDYFLQIAAELGLLGLGLFAAWLMACAVRAARALRLEPHDWRMLGAAAGVLAFLITSFSGHPLLVEQVAYAFWLQLGLMVALAGSVVLNADWPLHLIHPHTPIARQWRAALLLGGTAALAAIGVGRLSLQPPGWQAVDGFYGWETGSDGTPIRWTGKYASLFVPSDVRNVNVRVRIPPAPPTVPPIAVEAMIAGRPAGEIFATDSWNTLNLALPALETRTGFTRIDLRVARTWQPALYIPGSADMREVGVQVAAPQPVP